ncbi:MAG: hypothetical protein ACYTG7_10130 [Planctomycetota bacterium]
MKLFHHLYHRSGELLALALIVVIGGYLILSVRDARQILRNERSALAVVKQIYSEEVNASKSEQIGSFQPLRRLQGEVPLLNHLIPISLGEDQEAELFSDKSYLYYFRLVAQPKSVDDYVSGTAEKVPKGFEAIAWPHAFSTTGEVVYFIDDRGRVAISANERGQYDGYKIFPPDMDSPRDAVTHRRDADEFSAWRVRRIRRIKRDK